MKNYDKYLGRAQNVGLKTHFKTAIGLGFFFFGLYGYFAYAFYIGSILVEKKVTNTSNGSEPYSSGDIMSCFFGVVFGLFSLGGAQPNLKAVVEGRVAGKLAYDIINRKPKIEIDDPEGKKLENLKGRIEFKDVTFAYPTRIE